VQDPSGTSDLALLVEGAIALGLGLCIGLEREHRHVDEAQPKSTILGVRTFALMALAGWLSAVLETKWSWLPAVTLALLGLLIVAQYVRESAGGDRLGLTTEVAALLTVIFGLLVHHDVQLAVALALVTTLVLISKPWVRVVLPRLLRTELLAALQFLIVVAVVLPLLPVEPADPWGVLPPRKIGLFVVLVAGVGFVGYVLTRLLGRARAAGLTGVLGGITSSTAMTAAMAQQAGKHPAQRASCELAVLAANAIMPLRVLAVVFAVSRPVALELAPPMGAMSVVLLLATLQSARAARPADSAPHDGETAVRNPFALVPALKWGAFLCVVLIGVHFAQQALGDRGLLAAGALAGLADVDAITLASARQVDAGTLASGTAALAITLAVLSNSVVKGVIARVSGGPAFGRTIAAALGVAMAVALLVALLV